MADIRLNKHIADSGYCARRKADLLIEAGRVRVNGNIVQELGLRINPATDQVTVDNQPLPSVETAYIALHKPAGYVTSRRGGRQQKTFYELLPESLKSVDPAGRLDQDSSGLLILSTDGDFIHRITHPRYHLPKVYEVDLDRSLERQHIPALKTGLRLLPENKLARMETVRSISPDSRRLQVTLVTGYNRQIRRMFEALGYQVRNLKRVAFGPIALEGLPVGQFRPLTKSEIHTLLASSATAKPEQGQKPDQEKKRPVKNRRQQ